METHETGDAGVDTLRGPLLPLVTTSVLPDTAARLDTAELSTERVRHHDVLAEIEGSLLFWSIEKGMYPYDSAHSEASHSLNYATKTSPG